MTQNKKVKAESNKRFCALSESFQNQNIFNMYIIIHNSLRNL